MTLINLQGRLILVTRPLPEAEDFCRLIESCSGRYLLAPMLDIKPPVDSGLFNSAMESIDRYRGIIITSANGARAFLAKLTAGMKVPPIFAVGQKTAAIIKNAGYPAASPGQPSGSRELAAAIKGWQPEGGRLLFPRAEQGRGELVQELRGSGYQIDLVAAYRAEPAQSLPLLAMHALKDGKVDAIPLFSSRTGKALLNVLPPDGVLWLKRPVIIAISEVTKRAVSQGKIEIDLVAKEATGEGIIKSLSEYWQKSG
ncbi:MAG: uroporphyrinogen-III synthase [Magnetococcales bacterium]|nr:uroporphyrinogen-III synthase [Magnetococcales bacterium]